MSPCAWAKWRPWSTSATADWGSPCISGSAKGSASTADLRPQAIRDDGRQGLRDRPLYGARMTAPGLADPAELARDIPDLDARSPVGHQTPRRPSSLRAAARRPALAVDARITNSEGASVCHPRRRARLRQLARLPRPATPAPATASAACCWPRTATTCSATTGTRPPVTRPSIEAVEQIGRAAGERARGASGARRSSPRARRRCIFAAEVARGFFGHFVGAVRGSSQYRQSSFLLGAAGTQVLPGFLQMQERPHLQRRRSPAVPFDGEGVATRDRDLVRDGVLQGYVLGSYSARKLGLRTTGNAGGIHNLLVSGASRCARTSSALRPHGRGPVRHRADGPGRQRRHRRLFARRHAASGSAAASGDQPVQEITIAGNLQADVPRHRRRSAATSTRRARSAPARCWSMA